MENYGKLETVNVKKNNGSVTLELVPRKISVASSVLTHLMFSATTFSMFSGKFSGHSGHV